MSKRYFKKNSLWQFSIHADKNKGPNRIIFNPTEALKYFTHRVKNYPNDGTCVVVTYRPRGLSCVLDKPGDLEYFINNLIKYVGETKRDRCD